VEMSHLLKGAWNKRYLAKGEAIKKTAVNDVCRKKKVVVKAEMGPGKKTVDG